MLKALLTTACILASALTRASIGISQPLPEAGRKEAPVAEIRLGALFPLTGYAADVGQSELNSTLLAVDEINAHGGVSGKTLKLVIEDDRSDFTATASAMQKLVSIDKTPAVLGPTWAEFAEIAAPIAEGGKTVLLSASATSAALTENRRFIFTTMPSHESALRPFSAYLAGLHPSAVTLIKAQNAYYEQLSSILSQQLSALQTPISQTLEIMPGQSDFRAIISRLKQRNGAVVLFIGIGSETGNFLKQAREQKLPGPFFSGHNILFDEVVNRDRALADGVVLFEYYAHAADSFITTYRQRFGSEPIYSAPMAYDNVFLLKHAIEQCGDSSQQIRDCLARTEYRGVSGQIGFDSKGRRAGEQNITRLLRGEKGRYSALPD